MRKKRHEGSTSVWIAFRRNLFLVRVRAEHPMFNFHGVKDAYFGSDTISMNLKFDAKHNDNVKPVKKH